MQIQCIPILKVIFVLSTIVTVTDCCSSRILLLRQHTLQIEEHVVQLVNQLELQQQQQPQPQLNFDGQTSAQDIFADAAKMLQVSPDLGLETDFATTEYDRSTEPWSLDEETTTSTILPTRTTTTAAAATTTTTTMTASATTTTLTPTITEIAATGEPPPDNSTPPQLATDVTDASTFDLNAVNPTRNPKLPEDLSFQFPCSEEYLKYFCLNGGNCFRWAKTANSFSYCVCAVGYVGERCDSKTENGVYVPLRPPAAEPQLKTAHIVFSFPMLVLLSTIYVLFGAVFMLRNVSAQRRKQQQTHLHKQRFFVSC